MADLVITAEEVRKELGEYLTKPLVLDSGTLSTQTTISSTTLTSGGLSGAFIIKGGNIQVVSVENKVSVYIGF